MGYSESQSRTRVACVAETDDPPPTVQPTGIQGFRGTFLISPQTRADMSAEEGNDIKICRGSRPRILTSHLPTLTRNHNFDPISTSRVGVFQFTPDIQMLRSAIQREETLWRLRPVIIPAVIASNSSLS